MNKRSEIPTSQLFTYSEETNNIVSPEHIAQLIREKWRVHRLHNEAKRKGDNAMALDNRAVFFMVGRYLLELERSHPEEYKAGHNIVFPWIQPMNNVFY